MTQLGDRRASVRLEVVGSLWASLELNEIARVINSSETGALVASRTPSAIDAIQPVHLQVGGRDLHVTARVRHVRRATALDGSPEYLIGLEFVPSHGSEPALS